MPNDTDSAPNPYASPDADLGAKPGPDNMPGLKRLPYCLGAVICIAASVPLQMDHDTIGLVWLVIALAGAVGGAVLTLLRLRNIGWSSWWIIGYFVPAMSLPLTISAMGLPSGYAHTKTLDAVAKRVFGFFAGLFVLAAVVIVVMLRTAS